MKVFNSYVRRAEEFSHDKQLGGGIPGHILGYGMAALDPFIQGAFNATDYLFPIPKGRSKSIGSETSNKIIDQLMPNQHKKKKPKRKGPVRKQRSRVPLPARRARAPVRNVIRQGTARRKPTGIPVVRRSRGSGRRVAAPVVTGRVRQSGAYMQFDRGSRPGCIMISGKIQIAEIVVASKVGSDDATYISSFFNRAAGDDSVFAVAPQNSYYVPSPIWVLAQLFERFRMKTRLHYYGSSGTGTTGIVKFAFFEDPLGFYATSQHGGKQSNDSSSWPRSSDFVGLTEATEGPVWGEFSTPWSHEPKAEDMRYVPAPTYTSSVDPLTTSFNTADLRQTTAGMWVTTSSNVNPGTAPSAILIGDLWMEYRLELCDIMTSPTSIVIESLSSHSSLRKPLENKQQSKLEALVKEFKILKASFAPDDGDDDDDQHFREEKAIPRVFPHQVKEFTKSLRTPLCEPQDVKLARRDRNPGYDLGHPSRQTDDGFLKPDLSDKVDISLTQPSSKKSSSLK